MTDTTASEAPKVNRRVQAKARTASRVLEAARAEFETVGYEKGTIRAIAKRAGMSTGAVFANYEDKAELYAAVFGHAPLTPEQGRDAMRAVRAMTVWLGEDFDLVDALAAFDRLRGHCHEVIQATGFPGLPFGPDPDETALVDVMQWAIEARV